VDFQESGHPSHLTVQINPQTLVKQGFSTNPQTAPAASLRERGPPSTTAMRAEPDENASRVIARKFLLPTALDGGSGGGEGGEGGGAKNH